MPKKTPNRPPRSAPKRDLPLVYLAGPIAGCNELQRVEWRREARTRHAARFRFVDPTDSPVEHDRESSRFEIARRDASAIRQADAVLANMWKESIGTAIGVVEARRAGKIVVVVDRNRIQSTFLAYFADAVARSVDDGLRQIQSLLDAQRRLEAVQKRDGAAVEPFDREKLARSLRAACAAARKNDVLVTAEILPQVMRALLSDESLKDGRLPSTSIRNAVHAALDALEGDDERSGDVAGIREAWDAFVEEKRQTKERGRLELLRDAYEGANARQRISAEIELTGQCPMNALRLCTQFEDAWMSLGRALGAVPSDGDARVADLGNRAFHSISVKAESLRRQGRLPNGFPRLATTLQDARRARNAIIHAAAFNRESALRVLEGYESLSVVARALS